MYSLDCKDPNCSKCWQALKGQISKEGNQCKIPETIEQNSEEESRSELLKMVKEDLFFAVKARGKCLLNCRKLKEEIHHKIGALISILKERELDLCIEIEREYSAQVEKIDQNVTLNCVNKIMKKYDEIQRPSQTSLIFESNFDSLKATLSCFGKLRYDHARELNIKWIRQLNETFKKCNQSQAGTGEVLSSGCSSEVDLKTTFRTQNTAFMSSAYPVEVNLKGTKQEFEEQKHILNKASLKNEENLETNFKDKLSLDLKNIQTIKMEDVDETIKKGKIKDQSHFSGDYFQNKKCGEDNLTGKDLKELWARLDSVTLKRISQSSESTDSMSNEEVEKDSSLDEDDIEIISRQETEAIPAVLSFSPPLPPKNPFKFNGKRPACLAYLLQKKVDRKPSHSLRNSENFASSGIGESESQESPLSSSRNTELEGNQSINEEPYENSTECFDSSKDVGQDNNPTVALRSSFTKYLEKNPESEWLAPVKSSEQSESTRNNCKERVVPIFDQWLPAEYNQKLTSVWLHPAHM